MRVRPVPENRIKRLASFASVTKIDAVDDEWTERLQIEGIARSIAEKLFEHKKVLTTRTDAGDRTEVRTEIEVIVPDGPPTCQEIPAKREMIGPGEIPPFYITQTLLGFPGEDLNSVFLNLPDGSQIMLRGMNEPRTESDWRTWRRMADRLSRLWPTGKIAWAPNYNEFPKPRPS